jgi:hypothetical protein
MRPSADTVVVAAFGRAVGLVWAAHVTDGAYPAKRTVVPRLEAAWSHPALRWVVPVPYRVVIRARV